MTIQDCINFTNENPICSLATIDNGQPRVRLVGFWFADETGFYFQTGAIKDMAKQLKINPKMEACFYKQEGRHGTMMRLAGEVEFLDDIKLKERALRDRPFLKEFGLTADSPRLLVFRLSHGKAYFWNEERNLLPKEYIEF
jgi:pyridoxamine 5'-phosphate oxidase